MEEFRTIVDYPNYSVSNLGNIRNDKTKKILKASIDSFGYCRVCLKKKAIRIHKLVGGAFLKDNPNNYTEIDHIDNNKNNNAVSNLTWISRSGNVCKIPKYKGQFGSIYKGIYFHKKNNNWCASITVDMVKTHLGSFQTEILAVEKRNNYILDNSLSHYLNIILL